MKAHAKYFFNRQFEALCLPVVSLLSLTTQMFVPRNSNSILSRKILTVYKSIHNQENQLFWRTEICNKTLSQAPPRGAGVPLVSTEAWLLYYPQLHRLPPPPTNGLLMRHAARTTH